MKTRVIFILSFLISLQLCSQNKGGGSPARRWMDVALEMVKQDGGGPTIHSRNLFHLSAVMFDAWAMYSEKTETYLAGNTINNFQCDFTDKKMFTEAVKKDSLRDVSINYAAYRLLRYRFNLFGTKGRTLEIADSLFDSMALDAGNHSVDYKQGDAAALGNYIAECYINYGLQDGANEIDEYENISYNAVNSPLDLRFSGVQNLSDKNRWQPLNMVDYFHKKGGDSSLYDFNLLQVFNQDDFLSADWGEVSPFALEESEVSKVDKDGEGYKVYFDPGAPPTLNFEKDSLFSEQYKWGFVKNLLLSSYLDPSDSVYIDISPAKRGKQLIMPDEFKDYAEYYTEEGFVKSEGHDLNPFTKQSYEENKVLRGDYGRVIAEYWVDGVNTYSPPGHWIKWLNKVSDDKNFERKWKGKGKKLTRLEWDIRSYLTLCGALHDAGIAAWSVKNAYDYIRPISAIRYMAEQGQSSDTSLPSYHPEGLPLIEGKIELIKENDPLAGENKEFVDKLKVYCWKGPDHVNNPKYEVAGVGWIRAIDWWPYQRYSFATPSFAGYVSGHSTFSYAAAEVLTIISGSEFFPGGIASFTVPKNSFLIFEEGPSEDITLQWATYKDAANETALSRIWGGIHPPCDDLKGRQIGLKVGKKAVEKIDSYFK